MQEFDFGLVRNGDPWKFIKKKKNIGRGLCFDSTCTFPPQDSPKARYRTREVEIKATLVNQEQQMGFVAVFDLSNLIKWVHCVTFVLYTSGWVARCWIVGVPFSVMGTTTCTTIFETHVASQAMSLMIPCLSAKLAVTSVKYAGRKTCVATSSPCRHALVIRHITLCVHDMFAPNPKQV